MVDDNAFGSIGQNCPNLVEMDAGKTWITDSGMQKISICEENGRILCPKLKFISILETKVTPLGLAVFLKYHPMAVKINHSESLRMFSYPIKSKYNLVNV